MTTNRKRDDFLAAIPRAFPEHGLRRGLAMSSQTSVNRELTGRSRSNITVTERGCVHTGARSTYQMPFQRRMYLPS